MNGYASQSLPAEGDGCREAANSTTDDNNSRHSPLFSSDMIPTFMLNAPSKTRLLETSAGFQLSPTNFPKIGLHRQMVSPSFALSGDTLICCTNLCGKLATFTEVRASSGCHQKIVVPPPVWMV